MAPLRTGDGFPDVVVTAVASTNSLEPDAETTWQLLLEGQSGIRHLDKPFVGEFKSPVRIGGPLQESFDEHLSRAGAGDVARYRSRLCGQDHVDREAC